MMKATFCLSLCALLCLFQSCSFSSGGNGEKVVTPEDSVQVAAGPEAMQVSDVTETFTWKGHTYQSMVKRTPDPQLPVVRNEQGETFVDNRIRLQIVADGKSLVDRVLTKSDFAEQVNPRFMQHAILEGVVFDKVTEEGIVYAASVCYPQSDLYIPLRITVSAKGALTVEKEDMMDEPLEADSVG